MNKTIIRMITILVQLGFSTFVYGVAIPTSQFEFGSSDVQARVAGGVPLAEASTSAPWMASLRDVSGELFCGAVVVDEYYLLTAAHCIAEFLPEQFNVQLDRGNFAVDRVWIPSDFRWSSLENDVAVIRTQASMAGITPLAFADSLDIMRLQTGDSLTVLGFGQLNESPSLSNLLTQGTVPFVAPQQCAESWRPRFPSVANMIINQSICASGAGNPVDTCTGDSGGPILIDRNGWKLLGLTSFGEPRCGGADKPSIYSRVDSFRDSLNQALNGDAYSTNWQQTLIEEGVAESRSIRILNTSNQAWQFTDILNEAQPFIINRVQSSCLNSSSSSILNPGMTCDLVIDFAPQVAGFQTARLSLGRINQSPLRIDLQGFAYAYVPPERFGDQSIFSFIGGEQPPEQILSNGVSAGGYLQWSGMPPLTGSKIYIGTERAQTVSFNIDFLPSNPDDQQPTLEIRRLSAFEDELVMEIDAQEGWQSRSFTLATDDFLYVSVQSKGLGFDGQLRIDVAGENEPITSQVPEFALNSGEPGPEQPAPVNVEAGGSVNYYIMLLCLFCFRRSATKFPTLYKTGLRIA